MLPIFRDISTAREIEVQLPGVGSHNSIVSGEI